MAITTHTRGMLKQVGASCRGAFQCPASKATGRTRSSTLGMLRDFSRQFKSRKTVLRQEETAGETTVLASLARGSLKIYGTTAAATEIKNENASPSHK